MIDIHRELEEITGYHPPSAGLARDQQRAAIKAKAEALLRSTEILEQKALDVINTAKILGQHGGQTFRLTLRIPKELKEKLDTGPHYSQTIVEILQAHVERMRDNA